MGEPSLPLPMFPLSTVLFPYALMPLHVFEPRYRTMAADVMAGNHEFGIVLIERGSEVGGGDQRAAMGTVARIKEASQLPDGRYLMMTQGMHRFRIATWLPDDPYPMALVEKVENPHYEPEAEVIGTLFAAVVRARALLSELGQGAALSPTFELHEEPEVALWQLCSLAPLGDLDRQRLLCVIDPVERADVLLEMAQAAADDLARMLTIG